MELTFEWDEDKSKQNVRKHGVTFEEAKTVFNDPLKHYFTKPSEMPPPANAFLTTNNLRVQPRVGPGDTFKDQPAPPPDA